MARTRKLVTDKMTDEQVSMLRFTLAEKYGECMTSRNELLSYAYLPDEQKKHLVEGLDRDMQALAGAYAALDLGDIKPYAERVIAIMNQRPQSA